MLSRSLNVARGLGKVSPALTRGIKPGGQRLDDWAGSWKVALNRCLASAASVDTLAKPEMFCYQCEQTKSRRGCVKVGVCGKTPETAALQDLLVYALTGLSVHASRALEKGLWSSEECDNFFRGAMFSTLTNVNFDPERFPDYIRRAVEFREEIRPLLEAEAVRTGTPLDPALNQGPAAWQPLFGYDNIEYLESEGHKFGVLEEQKEYGPDVNGVRYMTIYGLKGLAAYSAHAVGLGESDPWVPRFMYQALSFLVSGPDDRRHDLGANLEMALKVGEVNMRVLELLDRGHRRQFGTPKPTTVSTQPISGKCIMISGHDMVDLSLILPAAKAADVNVYTHGEMLPAHSYPGLNKHQNLVGHFGGAWQNQKIDFAAFPGPVLASTNCVIEPLRSYRDRLYTLNDTGISGVKHIDLHNPEHMEALMQHAKSCAGFDDKTAAKHFDKKLLIGFSREAIVEHAETVLDAVSKGDLKRLFVIGGCDGSEHKRSYFTNLAKSLPPQTLILTMGCAKYRFNDLDFGTLGNTGIPRVLDMGQCNDSYGAIMVAKALASALNTDINSLPLSISLSWFEQKAVAVLLSLLSLGVKNIRLGPVMPAFLTPAVREALKENFGLEPVDIRHPIEDMEEMMHYDENENIK
ncbi:HCP-like protein [Mya arenaria]|uniref:HCP-like protein n=1 Tax=Mya arenaria TaxID=6604 RepID=A0ABY7DYG7_MYAAR|nr:hydroxylamine reductase-like [Mya arenaria]WAR01832.1 HCP-like protein [Mya arenaria]